MSLKAKFISAVTAGAAIIAFSAFTFAQEVKTDPQTTPKQERREWRGGKRDGFGKGMRRGKFGTRGGIIRGLRFVNLTDDQKAQIKTIMETRRNAFAGNREEMRTIMTAKRDGTITPEQQAKLEEFKVQMKEDAKKTHEAVMAILTPEQRDQLAKQKEEMKRKREERQLLRQQKTPTPTEKKDN
jgi:Spy/CpxP family protein refolding chaperone